MPSPFSGVNFCQRRFEKDRDSFVQEGPQVTDIVHRLTGRFDARIDIAHYNYQHGTQPYHRVVSCKFNNVRDFYLDLRDVAPHEWPINYVEMRPLTKQNEQRQMASYFTLVFAWHKLLDNQWTERKAQALLFQTAKFIER